MMVEVALTRISQHSMSRSLQVLPQFIDKVKQALTRSGFPRQSALSEDLGIARDTVSKFLNGKPISIDNFQEICNRLNLDWQEVSGFGEPKTIEQPAEKVQSEPAYNSFKEQLRGWLTILDYTFEKTLSEETRYFEWIIQVPRRRRGFDRILIRGVENEAKSFDFEALCKSVEQNKTDEGWLVASHRVSEAVRRCQCDKEILCYNFDELIDEEADFTNYINWLQGEVEKKKVDKYYIPLGAKKEEFDPVSKIRTGTSHYGSDNGWIEGYVDFWMESPEKEHLSILGEFGTGKTWFALHYAWKELQKYKIAKELGRVRPRLPLVIQLRDYTKALNVENVLAGFFYSKHNIRLSSEVFSQLNRMGKLLLIFDGFDEMASKVDNQKMVNNFWELARVIEGNTKAILTCRTEHFPEAQEGRKLLSAELKASTSNLMGKPPQFEVLELKPFDDEQIRKAISQQTEDESVVELVMRNPSLHDLARRPVMTELILEALPDIEQGKPVDISRVYLYAVRKKMECDIKTERTFTSLSDKLYFMCELAWEMLSKDTMKINYREFPDRVRKLFPHITEQADLDHWHYDMMGQSMLIRDDEGNYTAAHRSFLEFFVAYKFAAELGVLAEDFIEIAREKSPINQSLRAREYTWSSYFQQQYKHLGDALPVAKLSSFKPDNFELLCKTVGGSPFAEAVFYLIIPMLNYEKAIEVKKHLLDTIEKTKYQQEVKVEYVGGNAARLLAKFAPPSLARRNLERSVIKAGDFRGSFWQHTNLSSAILTESLFETSVAQVNSIAFSSDGKYFASGEESGIVRIWHVSSGREIQVFIGHKDRVRSVAHSSNGKQLASGSYDKTIKLWNSESGECLNTLEGHESFVWSVAYSSNGKQLASGSYDRTIKLWNSESGECLNTLRGHESFVWSVAYSSDGKQLASGSYDKTIKLWNSESGECLNTLRGHESFVWSVAYSPDGKQLASGSYDRTIKLWNSESGECLNTLRGHADRVCSVAYSPDGKQLASGSYDRTIKLWNSESGECLNTLRGHANRVCSVAYSPDGELLVSGSDDKTIKLWNSESGECLNTLRGYANKVCSVAYSSDRKLLVSGSDDKTIKLWNSESEECLNTLSGHENGVCSVAYSPDGKLLASGSYDRTIKLWNSESGECLNTLSGHENGVLSVAYSPDGKLLVSGSDDNTIKLWNSESGECLNTLSGHENGVLSVAYSPNGKLLASGSYDRTIKLWNSESGECLNTLSGHENGVLSVAYSLDGKQLASGSYDRTIKLWNSESGECLHTLSGHENGVLSVAYSPDGKLLVSGSDDNTIKLWNSKSGECLNTLSGHENRVLSVAYSPDGKQLASGSYDNTIKLWNAESGECLFTIKDVPYRGMDITSVIGLTEAQKLSLKLLGAVDHSEQ
jgi:WD40 repeat protein/transcriptional regulator with XRE-family HTH domain